MSAELARLRWRCRRGMRELDTVLQPFLAEDYPGLAEEDKRRFEALLELPDPLLRAYLLGLDVPADREFRPLIERIRSRPRS